jgi:uncharacterized protein
LGLGILLETVVLYLLLGAFAGTLAGLLGVGGGLVIIPVLVFVFEGQGLPEAYLMHMAIGTSLATIVFTSIASVRAHHKRGAVEWGVFQRLTPGIVVGALLGAVIADALPAPALRAVFAAFIIAVALQMALDRKPAPNRQLPGQPGMLTAGGLIGSLSSLVGIGGGSLTVPFLLWCNVDMRRAVATSAACGLPIALAGAIGFMLLGLRKAGLPPWSTGYIYWPAFATITVATLVFAPLGARLAHTVPVKALKRFFAIFLAVMGLRMLLG